MAAVRTLTADRGDDGLRLDLMLRRHLADVRAATRTRVQRWIENGDVTINGCVVSRVARRTAYNDIVTIRFTDTERLHPVASDADAARAMLDVLYEDDHLLAVNKPAGVVVHPTYRNAAGTLMNALLWHAREWPHGQRPSLVSRLDKLTSGILIVAKSAALHAGIQREMRSGESEKDYLAVVFGRVNVARGSIDLRLGFDAADRRRIVASTSDGLSSTTGFERVARKGGLSLVRCRLVTGRRHQIRVHLAARGWPIVGDPTYLADVNGTPRWSEIPDVSLRDRVRAFPRQALHAARVAFTHPVTGGRVAIDAPLPADLRDLMAAAGLVNL